MQDSQDGIKVVDQLLVIKKLNPIGIGLLNQPLDADEVALYADAFGGLQLKTQSGTTQVSSGNFSFSSDAYLKEVVSAEGYEPLTLFRDSDDVITSGIVKWPDGISGIFTTLIKGSGFNTIDSYSVSYFGSPTKTVTQPLLFRNVNGAVTGKPPLTIS